MVQLHMHHSSFKASKHIKGNWPTALQLCAGMFMAVLTAVAGPATEVFLINKLGLYHYSHATWAGIPTWIPSVYFCGSPAVGNLGRKVKAMLERNQTADAS